MWFYSKLIDFIQIVTTMTSILAKQMSWACSLLRGPARIVEIIQITSTPSRESSCRLTLLPVTRAREGKIEEIVAIL
jgi:hypothetical protein